MASADVHEVIHVEVVYSPGAGQVQGVALELPSGASVQDAVLRSGLLSLHPELSMQALVVGVWGGLRRLDDPLRHRDRVEIYRPLQADPKEARRQRGQKSPPKKRR